MISLDASTVRNLAREVVVPGYDREVLRGGIVHIGVGNFFRTHLAAYVDRCLHAPGAEGWGIVGVGLTSGAASRSKANAFHEQDCLYTLTEFADDGRPTVRVIGSMIAYLHAPEDPEAVLERLSRPETKIVSLTITEGGYNIDEETGAFRLDEPSVAADLQAGTPATVFGYVVEALRRRRSDGLSGLTVMSCDNLRGSGDTTRKAILAFADAKDADLGSWIRLNVDFPNSMVDRLAPQVPEQQRAALNGRSGIADLVPVYTEAFSQWVMEDRFRHGRPDFETVGVQFDDDVAGYLSVKGRIINAAHVFLSYPALLLGHRIVAEALHDPALVKMIQVFLSTDAVPLVRGPAELSVEAYAGGFVPRFANRSIADQLLRVAGDGNSKLPTFHGETIRALAARGLDLRREAFLLACFARYLRFRGDDALRDDLGTRFTPFEPSLSDDDWARIDGGAPSAALELSGLRALRLAENAEFMGHFDRYAASIARSGSRPTLEGMLAEH